MSGALAARGLAAAVGSRIAVLAAMREELAPLIRRTRIQQRWTAGNCRAVIGKLENAPVVLATTGDGARNALDGSRALLAALPVSRVLVVGVAGGLSPDLEPGDLVACRRLVEGGRPCPDPDLEWLQAALRTERIRPGCVLTSPRILGTNREKVEARQTIGDGPAVVDLESASFARAAAERGLPFLIARAVSDTLDESLPLDLNAFRDSGGAIRRAAIARHVISRPQLVRPLWRLRERVTTGSEALARFVCSLLEGEGR